jgi:hypothetical protein
MGDAIEQHRYAFSFDGMPIQSGIDCAKFLVNIVLGHYRFVETHPIVGGKTIVGVVTLRRAKPFHAPDRALGPSY